MTADERDFLARVKAAQDVGLTSAEVWRGQVWPSNGEAQHGDMGEPIASVCRRCKKPTEHGARWCYDCERAMWGDE